MIKHKLFHLVLLLCTITLSTSNSFSQKLEIEWGDSFDSATDVQKILGFSDKTMVAFSTKGKKRYIETFDGKGLSLSGSTEYTVPTFPGNESGLLNIALSKDKVAAIVYAYNKKTKSFSLYLQKLTTGGKQVGKTEEIYSSDVSDERIKDRTVDVSYSPDNSKLLVFFDRTDKDRITFFSDVVVIDLDNPDGTPTVGQYKFEMREAKSETVQYKMYHSIEDNGSYFFMQEKIEFAKKVISNFALNITGYNLNGDKFGEVKLSEEGKVLLSPSIIANGEEFHVVGYYMSNPKKRAIIAGYAGLFVADLQSDLSVKTFKASKFEDDFFKDLYSQKRIAKMNEKGNEILVPAPYSMDHIILHSNGTMTILSEYYLVTVTDNGKGQRTTTTNYGPIIMFKINAEGEILADDVIKKNQISSTTSIGLGLGGGALTMFVSYETKDNRKKYWSYALSATDENIYLVFNDHFKNIDDSEDDLSKALGAPSKSIPYLVTIDSEGSFTKKAMTDSGDTETYCVPQITYNIDEQSFIIWGVWRKENKFGRATIK